MMTHPNKTLTLWQRLGPGLLFAAAAIGVSHIVQSTRAGAGWGLAMGLWIIVANVVKYPAFRFGPEYAAATGHSLIHGYQAQGKWALWLYGILTLATMFTVQAAVTLVTASLILGVFGLPKEALIPTCAGTLAGCATLLWVGRYQWLDRLTRVLVLVLTCSTVVATAVLLPKVNWGEMPLWISPWSMDLKTLFFLVALVGWMPSAVDVSVWHSLWTRAKADDLGEEPSVAQTLTDFHIGYIGTAFLALCFMVLGAGVMYSSGVTFAQGAGGFANQVLTLYTNVLGQWSAPFIGISAIAVMFSTTLAVLDGFPRASAKLLGGLTEDTKRERKLYGAAVLVLSTGSILVLWGLLTSLKAMVDIATTLSFLTAPLLAILNHRAMMSDGVPQEARPKGALRTFSLVSIVVLVGFALFYLGLRLFAPT